MHLVVIICLASNIFSAGLINSRVINHVGHKGQGRGCLGSALTHGPLHVCQGFPHPTGQGACERTQDVLF